ncbi:MAG: hypothetical protein H0U21_00945 [Acidimicrobiia bacterium]|nr:hypothetical protein [Acidimicrobiia bacterium]
MAADKRATRLGILALVAVMLFGAIGTRLWFLQTVQADALQETVDATKRVVERINPERGRIFDADGRILADNKRVLTVSVDWRVLERSTDRAELFSRLSSWLDMTVDEMEARYDSGVFSRYSPLPLKRGILEPTAIALRERVEDFPGVMIETGWERVYPYAPLAAHVVGYMGAITAEDADAYRDAGYDISSQGEDVGRGGVEMELEHVLHGQWGQAVYEVDANNRVVRQLSYKPPVNGMDLQLSVDLDLQQYAEQILATQLAHRRTFTAKNPEVERILADERVVREPLDRSLPVGAEVPYKAPAGSVIVMNEETGEVAAMASYPTFDNRWFSSGLSDEKFEELFGSEDPDQSVFANRAIQGQYNLGSSFKPFVAYAALATGQIGAGTIFNDTGTYRLQSMTDEECRQQKCIYRNAICSGTGRPCVYGPVDVETSLAVSSDAFYYHLGEEFFRSGGTVLQDQIRRFGFGAETGVDLPDEFDGRIPTDELKQQLIKSGALDEDLEVPELLLGDEINMSIGQGLLAASPIQLAVAYATIANGGRVLTPRVVQAIYEPETPDDDRPGYADLAQGTLYRRIKADARRIPMTDDLREPITTGLARNVTGPGANGLSTTAEELFDIGYPPEAIPVAGKTGTAQGFQTYPWNDSSAFGAFSLDAQRPWTVVSYLEKAGYGSQGAAPVVKCMYLALSGITPLDPVEVADALDPESTVAAEPLPRVDLGCTAAASVPTVRPQD